MANAMYGLARQQFAQAGINWDSSDIRVICVDLADYTLDIDVDEFLEDIPVAARVATSTALQNKSSDLGVLDADDIEIAAVSGDQFEAIVVYKHEAASTETTSRLIAFIDGGATFTPNGGALNVRFDATGIANV